MRVSNVLLAGVGAALIAGTAYAAERVHTLNVVLPDGLVEHIHYIGEAPPVVAIAPVRHIAPPIAFTADPLFAAFDRMFADMDRQAALMLHRAAAMPAIPFRPDGKLDPVALKSLPGGVSYSYYSVSTAGQGGCIRSFQMTSYGQGERPKVVRQESGDCTGLARPMEKVAAPAAPVARTIPVKTQAPAPRTFDPRTI